MVIVKKRLGQHWLKDEATLAAIAEAAKLSQADTVLEIGPGLGHLTKHLLQQAKQVIAVEIDKNLAKDLSNKFDDRRFYLHQGDILKFDLSQLPTDYKVVANIPYYLTSNLLRVLSESASPPVAMTLLVQKEVAQRICAAPGQMSLLSVSVQLYYDCQLGQVIPAKLFTPPPKVDSQIVVLQRHPKPLFHDLDSQKFFRIVKAGFSERRKKLRSSLSGGLGLSKAGMDELLGKAKINGDLRAQNLSLQDWYKIHSIF